MKIFFSTFIDIYKIFYMLDPIEADDFKSKNEYFYLEKHKNKVKKEHSHDHSSCTKKHSKIHIPYEQMSLIQKRMSEITDPSLLITYIPNMIMFLQMKF